MSKNQSKFQSAAFLFDGIQISIDFYPLTWQKMTFKLFQQQFHPSLLTQLRPSGSMVDTEAKFYVILFIVINPLISCNFEKNQFGA